MSGDAGEYLLMWYPELQHVVDLRKGCLAAATDQPTGASQQPTLKPFWPLHSVAFLATSYLVIRSV